MYDVSSLGRVRSWRGWGGKRRVEARYLVPTPNHDGYPVVSLVGDTGRRQHFLHRLVASAFLGPRPEGRVVAHSDGNPANARVDNLRYATAAENEADKARHGTKLEGARHPRARLSSAAVSAIREEYAKGTSQTALAARYGTHQTNVSLIVRGRARVAD